MMTSKMKDDLCLRILEASRQLFLSASLVSPKRNLKDVFIVTMKK